MKRLNKNNNSIKKRKKRNQRISMKKTMHAGSLLNTIQKFVFGAEYPPLNEEFIIATYFSKGAKKFQLIQYPGMYTERKWDTKLLTQFIKIYNDVFHRSLYLKVLFMLKPQTEINDWNGPQDILNDGYITFLLHQMGFIYPSSEIQSIIQKLHIKNDIDCEIEITNQYYNIYNKTIGKGGFGTLFECLQNKVIKFIYPLSIVNNDDNYISHNNGWATISNIVSFLNEVTILITLHTSDSLLFKTPYSFGYKTTPGEIINNINKPDYENDNMAKLITPHPGAFYIVMDNMGETLENKLTSTTEIEITEKLQYLQNLVDGLTIIHKNNFFHGDIKSINILVGNDNIVRFIDFGVSKLITNKNSKRVTSTLKWSPPNHIKFCDNLRGAQLLNVDIYQLGLIFYFVLLEDKNFLDDETLRGIDTPDILYELFNNKVYAKLQAKMDENADIVSFCSRIIYFIVENKMLTFNEFEIVPETESKCRMETIKEKFDELFKKFSRRSSSISRSSSQ